MSFAVPGLDKRNWGIYTREKPVMKREAKNIFAECAGDVRRRYCRRFIPLVVFALLASPNQAHASLFHGETLDSIANVISWVVLIIGPIIGIVVFWMVHILPEKIAEKKKHPQTKAIQCVCLLSLCFGGLLWPIAWLWAYTKPVLHKMAYGTDVDESHGHGEKPIGEMTENEKLRARVAELEGKLSSRGAKA
jgi:CBS domain containing-hemolysin-like protein